MKNSTIKILSILFLTFVLGCSKLDTEKEINNNVSESQSERALGVIFLSKEKYAKLPVVDFDLLERTSMVRNKKNSRMTTSSTASTTDGVFLIAPSSGDQGMEGSCVGWAVGYSAMGILTLPRDNYNFSSYRSPEYIYNQIKIIDCAGGTFIVSALDLIKNQGVCSWQLMPYTDSGCSVQPNQSQINDASNNKSTNYATIPFNNVTSIKNAISLGWPVVVGFDVNSSFRDMWYGGGVWDQNYGSTQGGHAACIVGYDDTRKMFKVQNQWGNGGDGDGFFWVTYSLVAGNCFREAYVVYTSNSSAPLSLTGPQQVCTDATYSIENVPSGSSITWSAIPSGIVTLSASGNSVIVSKIAGGIYNLKATVTNVSGHSVLNRTGLKAGSITPVSVTGSKTKYAPNSPYTFSSEGNDWIVQGGTIDYGQGTNTITVTTNGSGKLLIRVRDINCGGSPYFTTSGTIDPNLPPF